MRSGGRWAVKGVAIAVGVTVVTALAGLVVMLLWNALVPGLFHGPTLLYWQAVGVLILSRMLFGGLRARGGWHGPWRQRMWRERWEQMTPEERAQLRERYMSRCGQRGDTAEAATAEPKS